VAGSGVALAVRVRGRALHGHRLNIKAVYCWKKLNNPFRLKTVFSSFSQGGTRVARLPWAGLFNALGVKIRPALSYIPSSEFYLLFVSWCLGG